VLRRQIIIAVVFGVYCLAAEAAGPERTVENNVIISERDPKVRIELPKSVKYVGADRWVLYDIAECELHAFLETDSQQNVQRLYWVQFEGYLPTKPELKHQYDSPRHTTIGGLDFYVDTWTGLCYPASLSYGATRSYGEPERIEVRGQRTGRVLFDLERVRVGLH
jgi:hypothetical protein